MLVHVEAPEHERRVADVEVGEPPLRHVPGDVPFEAGLVRAAGADVRIGGSHALRRRTHGLEPRVCTVDITLLGSELGIGIGAFDQGVPRTDRHSGGAVTDATLRNGDGRA